MLFLYFILQAFIVDYDMGCAVYSSLKEGEWRDALSDNLTSNPLGQPIAVNGMIRNKKNIPEFCHIKRSCLS